MNATARLAPASPASPQSFADPLADPDAAGRWAKALAIVLGVHAIPLFVAGHWLTAPSPPPAAEPAIFIDMAPPAAPPQPPSEQPPGPKQVEAEVPQPKIAREIVKTPPVANPAVAIPIQAPEPPTVDAQRPAPETTAPPAKPAVPAVRQSSGQPTWQGLVLAALDKRKRYPRDAQYKRQQGVPYIRFVMDRDGKVLSSRLERSSGFVMLDHEAVALPRRAQPLPKPPEGMPGQTIELVVPVEFFVR